MKKILTLALLTFICLNASSQKKDTKAIFKEYTDDKVYTVDGDNLVVTRVIDGIEGSQDDIYIKVKDYFTRAYNDANSVLQIDDKAKGVLVGKGIYSDYWGYKAMTTAIVFSAHYTIRVDIKENRIRVICSANVISYYNAMTPTKIEKYAIVDYAPITDKRKFDKGKQTQAFINLVDKMQNSIDNLDKTVHESSLKVENEDW